MQMRANGHSRNGKFDDSILDQDEDEVDEQHLVNVA